MKAGKNLVIVGDRVLIDPDEGTDKRSSGLYLPPTVREKEKVLSGYVVKTGPGYLEQLFAALSKEAPVVLAFDDIHWADAPSLDILHSLAQNCPDLPMLIVCLSRTQLDDVHPRWREQQSGRSYTAGWIDLKPLSPEESSHLLSAVLQKMKSMPEDLCRLAVSTAEGNPFYLEEIVRMLVDDGVIRVNRETGEWQVGAEKLDALRVPSTLTAVLQARLDNLPPIEREILQQASVVGRTFWDLFWKPGKRKR